MASLVRRLAKSVVPRKLRSRIMRSLVPQGDWRGVMDLRGVTDDPVAACYMAHRSSPVIDVPLSRCIGLQAVGVPFSPAKHPFVGTVGQLREEADLKYSASSLCAYQEAFAPKTMAEVLGLHEICLDSPLAQLPAAAVVLPWWTDREGMAVMARCANWRRSLEADYRQAGYKPPPEILAPNWFGPGNPAAGQIELERLARLMRSISTEGLTRHDRPDGDITGVVLCVSERPPRIMLHSGQHRAAVAAGLGMDRIPVRLFPAVSSVLIRRDEVLSWPHVRSGLFTSEQALAVFDRLLSGVPSSGWAADAT